MFPFAAERKASSEPIRKPAGADALLLRAPKLRDGGERVAASIVKALQVMAGTTTTIEGMVAGYAVDKPRKVLAANGPETAVGVIDLPELSCKVLATLDATLVHALVELLCGGNGAEPPPVAPRAVTPIDQQFAQIVFTLAASAVQNEWAEHGVGAARAAKVEGPIAADVLGARVEEVGVVNLTLGVFGLHGTLRLVLPPPVLAKFATDLLGAPAPADAPDPMWASLLRHEIERAPVALAAYLDAKDISLAQLAGLKAGQILVLRPEARAHATLMSEGRVLFRGELGQDDNRYSLRIEDVVGEPASVALMANRRAPYYEVSKA